MFDFAYHRRLKKDLARWIEQGLVPKANQEAILADIGKAEGGNKFPAIIGLLGGLLLAVGVMLFVSANWQEMSKLSRMAVLFTAMWVSFGAAVWLRATSHTYLLEGVLFLAAAIFGANIMLVAQIYHMDGHYPDALVLWALGAIFVALALYSPSALVMSFVLLVIWSGAEVWDFDFGLHWQFLPIWLVAMTIGVVRNWRSGLHAGFLALVFWLVVNGEMLQKLSGLSEAQSVGVVMGFVLCLFVGALAFEKRGAKWFHSFEVPIMRYAMIGFFALAFAMQFEFRQISAKLVVAQGFVAILAIVAVGALAVLAVRRKAFSPTDGLIVAGLAAWYGGLHFIGGIWLDAAILLGACVWIIGLGQKRQDNFMVTLALIGFGIEVLYLYAETLGTLLDTSVFFLFGGVLLIALAFGLELMRRRLSAVTAKGKQDG